MDRIACAIADSKPTIKTNTIHNSIRVEAARNRSGWAQPAHQFVVLRSNPGQRPISLRRSLSPDTGVIESSLTGLMSNARNGNRRTNSRSLPVFYNCVKCPAYCCSYDRVEVSNRDLLKLARHFGIWFEQAEQRYTKSSPIGPILRQKRDHIFKMVCEFLDRDTRECTIHELRPAVCQNYPNTRRCVYYDSLASERRRQCDDEYIPDA